MQADSGVSLVSGALQSSLAYAKKCYTFPKKNKKSSFCDHDDNKSSRVQTLVNRHLASYCESIGSKFASYSSTQFEELGASLVFEDGGFLERKIPKDVLEDCIILKQQQNVKTPPPPKEPPPPSLTKANQNQKSSPQVDRLLHILRDNTISKSKRRRITKRLRELQQQDVLSERLVDLKKKGTSSSSPQKEDNKKTTAMGPGPEMESNNNNKSPGPSTPTSSSSSALPPSSSSPSSAACSSSLKLPEPKRVLFPRERILLGWRSKRGPGSGFVNFGNTCYLNSSMQALLHIPAFVNWINNDFEDHRSKCNGTLPNQTPCILCIVYTTLQDQSRGTGAIRPRVLDKLKAICKHFNYGRQEDAHEFLRLLLEGMERSYLMSIGGLRLDNRTKETNPLGQIFGGYVRTEVTCLKCQFVSTTFQPSAELQLDIRHSTTLEDALMQHFRKERLDNNDYRCEKCRTISQATKQYSIEVPPLVLCLQLKRFTLFGNKISKRIHCNRILSMSRYLHKSLRASGFYRDRELKYRMVALVTHLGQSPNCGHYTAIAEGSNNSFYQFDDQFVQEVSTPHALNNDAYVIVYEMDRASQPPSSSRPGASSSSVPSMNMTMMNGSPRPGPLSTKPKPYNTLASNQILSNGSSSAKKFAIPFAKTNGASNSNSFSKNNGGLTSPSSATNQRQVNRFVRTSPAPANKINILRPGSGLAAAASATKPNPPSKLVLQHSNNNNHSSSNSKPLVVPKATCVKLVPYNDEEGEENNAADRSSSSVPDEDTFIGPRMEEVRPQQIIKACLKQKITERMKTTAAASAAASVSSPENTFGVKKKLEEVLGPTPTPSSSSHTNGAIMVVEEEEAATATTKWTVTTSVKGKRLVPLKTGSKSSSGYSSDPDVGLKKPKTINYNNRAKSMERSTGTSSNNFTKPLIPNSPSTKSSSVERNSVKLIEEETNEVSTSSGPIIIKTATKTAAKRRRSSSSQGEEEEGKWNNKFRKREKYFSPIKSLTRTPPSSDNDRSSSHRHSPQKKDDEDKSKSSTSPTKTEASSTNGWPREEDEPPTRSRSSVEREEVLRKARNPSRSPTRIFPSPSPSPEKGKEKFNPSRIIEPVENTIVGWNGHDSSLSKSISSSRSVSREKSSRGEFDEELDKGREKKVRSSRSPSREASGGGVNRFQAVQDNKNKLQSSNWSKILNGYGDGFRDHHNVAVKKKSRHQSPSPSPRSSSASSSYHHDDLSNGGRPSSYESQSHSSRGHNNNNNDDHHHRYNPYKREFKSGNGNGNGRGNYHGGGGGTRHWNGGGRYRNRH